MKPPPAPLPTLHATALIVGDAGVLIRGRSGAGKSRLAEGLVEAAQARGLFGRMVADDRVSAVRCNGRIVLSPHPAIAGLVERRGQGIVPVAHEGSVVLRLVVDLAERGPAGEGPSRYPEPADLATVIDGVAVPRLALLIGDEAGPSLVLRRLEVDGAQKRG